MESILGLSFMLAYGAWFWREAFRFSMRMKQDKLLGHAAGMFLGILGLAMGAFFAAGVFEPEGWPLAVGIPVTVGMLTYAVRQYPRQRQLEPAKPATPQTLYVPIDHEQVRRDVEARRDAEAQRALDAVRLPPPPYPYSAPAPRKRAPAKPVARIAPIVLPDRVEFSYQKADGTISHRIVKVNQVDRPGGKFTGFCETSWAVKTFKADGVLGTVTRHETGEIVPVEDWYQALQPSPKARAKR